MLDIPCGYVKRVYMLFALLAQIVEVRMDLRVSYSKLI